jgi:SAM-dependent methyltransferase
VHTILVGFYIPKWNAIQSTRLKFGVVQNKGWFMQLTEIITRTPRPVPWSEGEKIPWNEPGFSTRMLREHLSQDHDAASRRATIIDRQVDWIFQTKLGERSASVLDLGCGPGLYTSRLARHGCRCTGIDFSPASVAYAREQAQGQGLDCKYIEGDVRTTSFGNGFGLVMFIFGELNVFRSQDARLILQKAYAALDRDGRLVLEPHTFDAVKAIGQNPSEWYSASSGLFSESPHLYLQENFWDETSCTTTQRYFIVDVQSGAVTRYASTMQAYTGDQYRSLLEECGFRDVEFHPSLEGKENDYGRELLAITARR